MSLTGKQDPFGDDFLNPGIDPELAAPAGESSPFDGDPEAQYSQQQAATPVAQPAAQDLGPNYAAEQAAKQPAPPVVEKPAAPTAPGGVRRVSFGTTLSLDAFGLRFSSGNISREYEFATPVDETTANQVTEYLAHTVVTLAGEKILEQAAAAFKQSVGDRLPTQSAGAAYSQLPTGDGGAPQGQPTGNLAQQTGQLLAGDATGTGSNIVKIHVGTDDKGRDEFLYFPHPDAPGFNRTQVQNLVKEKAAQPVKEGGLGVHPTQIMVFDNREDLVGGKKAFSAGKIVISQEGAPEALNEVGKNRAIAWVKFDRLGNPLISATKDFKQLDVEILMALRQPALG